MTVLLTRMFWGREFPLGRLLWSPCSLFVLLPGYFPWRLPLYSLMSRLHIPRFPNFINGFFAGAECSHYLCNLVVFQCACRFFVLQAHIFKLVNNVLAFYVKFLCQLINTFFDHTITSINGRGWPPDFMPVMCNRPGHYYKALTFQEAR